MPLTPAGSSSAYFPASRQLRDPADLDALVAKGIAGSPERIGLQVEGTFRAGCECEPFHAWFSAPNESFAPIIAIAAQGAPNVGYRANLSFILVGYFSGAYINAYEKFRVLGVDPGKPDEEERASWPEREPEFCLEALCYSVPEWKPDPELGKDDESTRLMRQISSEHAQDMARLGIPKCKREWGEAR
jgi:hypothetical protein